MSGSGGRFCRKWSAPRGRTAAIELGQRGDKSAAFSLSSAKWRRGSGRGGPFRARAWSREISTNLSAHSGVAGRGRRSPFFARASLIQLRYTLSLSPSDAAIGCRVSGAGVPTACRGGRVITKNMNVRSIFRYPFVDSGLIGVILNHPFRKHSRKGTKSVTKGQSGSV